MVTSVIPWSSGWVYWGTLPKKSTRVLRRFALHRIRTKVSLPGYITGQRSRYWAGSKSRGGVKVSGRSSACKIRSTRRFIIPRWRQTR